MDNRRGKMKVEESEWMLVETLVLLGAKSVWIYRPIDRKTTEKNYLFRFWDAGFYFIFSRVLLFFLFFKFLNHFFIAILLQLSQFFPLCLPLPIPPQAPTVNPHTVVHARGSFIHALCLVPSPSFHRYPPLPSPLVTVSLVHVSMPVVLFCLLVYFVH